MGQRQIRLYLKWNYVEYGKTRAQQTKDNSALSIHSCLSDREKIQRL